MKSQPRSSLDYLDLIREIYDLPSDRQVSALLGISPAAASRYRLNKDQMADEVAIRAAELLCAPAAHALAIANFARAKHSSSKSAWLALAESYEPIEFKRKKR